MKKLSILLALFVFAICMLCACGGNNDNGGGNNETVSYEIKVSDYYGNPADKTIYVEIYKYDEKAPNGEKFVKMLSANKEGVATVKLNKGDYHFKLSAAAGEGEFYYDSSICTLSATELSKEITIYNVSTDKFSIFPGRLDREGYEIREEEYVPIVDDGANYVTVNGRSYFVFAPEKIGYYRVSVVNSEGVTLGYHGDANYVLLESNAEIENNSFEFKSFNGSGISRNVIALNSDVETNAILLIEYVRELEKDIPYNDLVATESKESSYDYDFLNKVIVDFDITDKNSSVVKGTDGYYHLNTADGPIIMVRITSASKYLASFKDICDKTRLACIEKDADGNVILKESYNDLILTYASKCDSAGICPLTDELAYVIKKAGQYMGWYEGDNTIFVNYTESPSGDITSMPIVGIVKENAWLFACCYLEPTKNGGEDTPISIKPVVADEEGNLTPYLVDVCEGETVYLKASANGKIEIASFDGLTVMWNNTPCTAMEGVITINAASNDIISITADKNCAVKLTFEQIIE